MSRDQELEAWLGSLPEEEREYLLLCISVGDLLMRLPFIVEQLGHTSPRGTVDYLHKTRWPGYEIHDAATQFVKAMIRWSADTTDDESKFLASALADITNQQQRSLAFNQ